MDELHEVLPQQTDKNSADEGFPEQTDNRPRDEDGEQDVSQDPDLAYDELEDAEL